MAERYEEDTVHLELTADERTADRLREMKDGVIVDFDLDAPPVGRGASGVELSGGSYGVDLRIEFAEREKPAEERKTVTADEIELVVEGEDDVIELEDVDVSIGFDADASEMTLPSDAEFSGSFSVTPEEVDALSSTYEMETAEWEATEIEPDFTSREFEVDPEVAKAVFNKVVSTVEQARKDGFEADEMILGVPQYKALAVHAGNRYDEPVAPRNPSPENLMAELGVEVTVVPGPMMHVVKDNGRVLMKHG